MGHHDDDFPLAKPAGELRGLVLGDPIAMGHGVSKDETLANQLERLLAGSSKPFTSFQVINAGVQGYSTFREEAVVLEHAILTDAASGAVSGPPRSQDERAAVVRRWSARIFLDQDHYTAEGHELVAECLRG